MNKEVHGGYTREQLDNDRQKQTNVMIGLIMWSKRCYYVCGARGATMKGEKSCGKTGAAVQACSNLKHSHADLGAQTNKLYSSRVRRICMAFPI